MKTICRLITATLMIQTLLTLGAWAQLPHPFDLSTLDGTNGVRFDGIDWGDNSGISVSGAGDVNGDGFADLVIGAYADPIWPTKRGQAHLIYGSISGPGDGVASLNLSSLDGTNGVRFEGIGEGDHAGVCVSGTGDVNGDGLADLLIGAHCGDPAENPDAGETHLLYGSASGVGGGAASLNLSFLDGTNGVRFEGINEEDYSGSNVSGAGDINGDGFADLLIGAAWADPGGTPAAGETHLVYGSSSLAHPTALNIIDSPDGVRFDGIDADDWSGYWVSGAGDVNGDGFADLMIGAGDADPSGNSEAGETYLVYGSPSLSHPIDLSALNGTNGTRFDGIDAWDFSGTSVSGAGDVNGDGFADLLIGAWNAGNSGPPWSDGHGEIYLIYGSTSFTHPYDLDTLDGTSGVCLIGVDEGDGAGLRVSGAGDINGDGLADLLVGAMHADPNGNSMAGETHLVYGSATGVGGGSASFELSSLDGINGVRFVGIDPSDGSGSSVSGAGDVNGDGFADLLIGAMWADPAGKTDAGESYLIYGSGTSRIAACRAFCRSGDAPRLGIGLPGDGSITTPPSRCWVDYDGGSGPGNAESSLEAVTLTRSAAPIRNLGDSSAAKANVMWEISTDRTGWGSAEVTFNYLDREIPLMLEDSMLLIQAPTPEGPWIVADNAWRDTRRNRIGGTVSSMGYFAIGGQRDPAAPSTQDILDHILGFTTDPTGLDVTGDGEVNTADLILSINIGGEG